jgi:hypothetical protein
MLKKALFLLLMSTPLFGCIVDDRNGSFLYVNCNELCLNDPEFMQMMFWHICSQAEFGLLNTTVAMYHNDDYSIRCHSHRTGAEAIFTISIDDRHLSVEYHAGNGRADLTEFKRATDSFIGVIESPIVTADEDPTGEELVTE